MTRRAGHHPLKIMCHGRQTLQLARQYNWLPGARYTNLRDVKDFGSVGMIDIVWRNYDFDRHLAAVKLCRPHITIARDVECARQLGLVLDQAEQLSRFADRVVIVPKTVSIGPRLIARIPESYLLGYSVPTRYGKTNVPLEWFGNRPTHLLGGRPDMQFALSKKLNVYSIDGNRVTLDAAFGDYFTGSCFRPHPQGGYYECIRASLEAIESMWAASRCL